MLAAFSMVRLAIQCVSTVGQFYEVDRALPVKRDNVKVHVAVDCGLATNLGEGIQIPMLHFVRDMAETAKLREPHEGAITCAGKSVEVGKVTITDTGANDRVPLENHRWMESLQGGAGAAKHLAIVAVNIDFEYIHAIELVPFENRVERCRGRRAAALRTSSAAVDPHEFWNLRLVCCEQRSDKRLVR